MTAIKNSSKGLGGAGEPSDLDLMLYLDGELEPDRSAEIEAAVVSDSALR